MNKIVTRTNLILSIFVLSLSLLFFSCGNTKTDGVKTINLPSVDRPTDLMLIYHGYETRPEWKSNDLKPYIYREKDGKTEWLFDGFLFLELFAKMDGKSYAFEYAVEDRGFTAPSKKVMDWLLDVTFAQDRGPDGLEQALGELAEKGIYPPYKRKVVFCIPTPQVHANEWGEVNGRMLDFRNQDDRVEGAKWYIDQILKRWNERDYKNLDFGGFYWLNEAIMSENDDAYVIRKVKDYLDEKKLELCWVPYYGAEGATTWKETGINYVYHQPNYFFNLKTPLSFVTHSIEIAKNNGGFMEMEFDDNVAQEGFRQKYYDYINEFQKAGVWETMPVAYYEGGGAWLRMATSEDEHMRKMYDDLCDIVVKREGKFSKVID